MEMLIVVAIIAVLIAIAIPIFTSQLESARDATSVANIRSAYTEAQAAYLNESDSAANINFVKTGNKITGVTVTNVAIESQQANDWSGKGADLPVKQADGEVLSDPGTNGAKAITFTYGDDNTVTASWAN
ncbi:MAG: hypothetical protein IKF78_12955 [Atopobiaceae bacterium]|nr:hypothetical protein [Atopobiaceae bacterium]